MKRRPSLQKDQHLASPFHFKKDRQRLLYSAIKVRYTKMHMNDQAKPAKKLLIVEDDQYLRELYVEILQDEGFDVDHASDGEEGYQKIYAGGYDLVLLDIMLPKMDGLKILEKVQKETPPLKPNRMIVVLSNLGQENAVSDAISRGARGYMIKSDFTPDQVINKVKEYLAS